MYETYLPILFSIALGVLFPVALILASTFLGPRLRHAEKLEPYESGVPPVGSVREGFSVKFYRIAIIFLIFEVETAFLFPWAVLFRSKLYEWGASFLIWELMIFFLVLVAGYVFAWRSGALEWE